MLVTGRHCETAVKRSEIQDAQGISQFVRRSAACRYRFVFQARGRRHRAKCEASRRPDLKIRPQQRKGISRPLSSTILSRPQRKRSDEMEDFDFLDDRNPVDRSFASSHQQRIAKTRTSIIPGLRTIFPCIDSHREPITCKHAGLRGLTFLVGSINVDLVILYWHLPRHSCLRIGPKQIRPDECVRDPRLLGRLCGWLLESEQVVNASQSVGGLLAAD